MMHRHDRLLKELDKLSPADVRAWVEQRTKNNYPRFTYKYRDTSTAEQQSWVRDILVNGQIWLSSPDAFNDPFDMAADVVFDGSPKEKRDAVMAKVKTLRPELSYRERQEHVTRFLMKGHEEILQGVRKAFAKQISSVGVCSFSDDSASILMWSHYAGNHTGICIQFEIAATPSTLLVASPVNYTKNHPKVNWANDTTGQLSNVILSKADAWKYEKERRFFAPDRANTHHALNPNAVSGVIFGCRTPTSVRAFVEQCNVVRISQGHQPFRLYEAIQSKQEYKITVESATGVTSLMPLL